MNVSSNVSRALKLACLLSVASMGAGCVAGAEPGADDGPVGKSQAALETTFGTFSYTWDSGNFSTPLDGPTVDGDTCFLTGVYGALAGPASGTTGGAVAGVVPNTSTGKWDVIIDTGTGSGGIRVDGACVSQTGNQVFNKGWGSTETGTTEWTGTALSQCFINEVVGFQGFAGSYDANETYVGLANEGANPNGTVNWDLAGWLYPQNDGNSSGGVSAVCVDIPITASGSASWSAGSGEGLITTTIVSDSGASVVCGLTNLAGPFYSASLTANGEDGAGAQFVDNGWNMVARNGKGSGVECVTLK